MVTPTSLDELKKQARLLENEIDHKLTLLSKACSAKTVKPKILDPSAEPLLGEERDKIIEDLAVEIEELLEKLRNLNDQMSDVKGDVPLYTHHTLIRHREILCDYKSEFQSTLDNYHARKQKEELMRSIRPESKGTSSGLNRRMDLYLKENEHIKSSSRLVDDQIAIAVETREELLSQRFSLKKLHARLTESSNRLPIINSITHRINFRRRRDSFIIGLIIFLCIMLLLTYVFY